MLKNKRLASEFVSTKSFPEVVITPELNLKGSKKNAYLFNFITVFHFILEFRVVDYLTVDNK